MLRPTTQRLRRRVCLAAALAAAAAGRAPAQYAAAANIGASVVPIDIGRVRLTATGAVDRHVSWIAPRTVLTLGTSAVIGSADAGASLGVAAERTAEVDSLPSVIALQGGVWRAFGNLLVRLDIAERALRSRGHDGSVQINQYWTDSLETDSGFVSYRTLHADTIVQPGTASRVNYWPELQAGVMWSAGRLSIDAALGGRAAVASSPSSIWGHVGGTLQVTRDLALAASTGISPSRIGLGVPASRYVSIALHIAPMRGDAASIAGPARAPAFAVRALGERRYTVSYVGAPAGTVELSGDFNGWTPIVLREVSAGDGHERWETTLTLAPGVYHVGLRVDGGAWMAPPGTPSVTDDFGGTAGIVEVR